MAKVSLQNVSKTFPRESGDITAVKDVSLEIADHELVVLAGRSGSGKSTILRLIAGLEEITEGDIFIGDRRVNDVPPKDRDVAMVFEDDALYPHMSVSDNMAFGLKLRSFSKAEIKKRVEDAAAILGLEALLERKPEELSREQRQRVALGRAVVRQPKVFLLDEPLSDLDAKMRAQLRTEITKLHQRLQATMIYVTHDQVEAMAMAGRTVVMDDGAVQQNDDPLKLYNEPVNLFVAGFFGSPPMNFVHGTLKQERDVLVFRELDEGTIEARFAASDQPAAAEFVGKPILLGIRPQDVEAVPFSKAANNVPASFPALVDIVEPIGAETNLYLQTGAHTVVCRSQGALDHRDAGHRMQCAMNLKKAHLFDPVSTNRIV